MSSDKAAIIGTSAHVTVDELLNSFHNAASNANLIEYFSCFHVEGAFLGTDPHESWSAVEFMAYAEPHFSRGQGWTYTLIPGKRKIKYFPNQNQPTFCTFDELLNSESFVAVSRGSGSAIYDPIKGTWLITAYHLNFPIPNPLAGDICKTIARHQAQTQEGHNSDEIAAELLRQEDEEKSNIKTNHNTKKKGIKSKR